MTNPIAVLISDIHYNLNTLELADAAMRQAITKANDLGVPLIVAGDLHDTKANMRGECVNAMIETFKMCNRTIILRGNHDSINEKSTTHSLNFLSPYANIVDSLKGFGIALNKSTALIPYCHDKNELLRYLKTNKEKQIIMHQGIQGSNSGDYFQDKSAITPEDVAGRRIISGHYHTRQTIALPDGGSWDYIGNPYSLNFGEALDPEKGFQILMSDGSLEFVPTKLRKHIIVTINENELITTSYINPNDLVWVKAIGSKQWLSQLSKEKLIANGMPNDFRLELIPTDAKPTNKVKTNSLAELLDSIIDQQSVDNKDILKKTWRDICES